MGIPRKYEFDGGKFDIPSPEEIAKPTPKELYESGKLTEQRYGPFDGSSIGDIEDRRKFKLIVEQCMNYLIDEGIKNRKNRPLNRKLRGGVNQILRELRKCYVHGILQAAEQNILLVHGYIREMDAMFNGTLIIPYEINILCIKYMRGYYRL